MLLENISSTHIVLFVIITTVFLLFVVFKKNIIKPDYYNSKYWERRYRAYSKKFDWYADTEKVFEDFNLKELFNNKIIKNLNKNKSKILELGCGSSTL